MAFQGNLERVRDYFFRYGFTKWVSWNVLTAFEVRNNEVLVPDVVVELPLISSTEILTSTELGADTHSPWGLGDSKRAHSFVVGLVRSPSSKSFVVGGVPNQCALFKPSPRSYFIFSGRAADRRGNTSSDVSQINMRFIRAALSGQLY